ncbi:hypothetical protein TSUD_215700 [Trifolium subterraneum]|uniref:Uncharacterized protein n=1 Tax=Trifolium subterraneum TaxID=3900 RepID=A0A2Z6N7Z2_TRISU|nr:hypothetical protein TSUD_215700 [Trifolium subterraneum]
MDFNFLTSHPFFKHSHTQASIYASRSSLHHSFTSHLQGATVDTTDTDSGKTLDFDIPFFQNLSVRISMVVDLRRNFMVSRHVRWNYTSGYTSGSSKSTPTSGESAFSYSFGRSKTTPASGDSALL